jgi:catechol 2,3-dioxygenase-like lactoylglutathione lyase family enzyme
MPATSLLKICVAVSLFPVLGIPQTTPVVHLQNLAHTTESLGKTVPFYRDVLSLPVNGTRDPLAQQPQKLDEELSRFTATKGMSFRAATFRIPNAAFGFELTEFTGGPRKSVRPNIQDIGAATLALQVRDLEKLVTKVKASGAAILTGGGMPLNPTGNPNSKLREIVVRDPDGFFVELQQPDPLPASSAVTSDDILGASVQFSIEDSAKTIAFLRDAIGFDARPTGALGTNPAVANLISLPGGPMAHHARENSWDDARLRADRVFRCNALESRRWRGRSGLARVYYGGSRRQRCRRAVDEGWRNSGEHRRPSNRARQWLGQCLRPRREWVDVGIDSARRGIARCWYGITCQ